MGDKQDERIGFSKVFPDELAYVRKRWQTIYPRRQQADSANKRQEGQKEKPTTDNRLVGLAFSGGGIRSATINLGMTQALHKHGALDHVDYMSTVSGGGYLGSSISTIMRDGAEFPYQALPKPDAQGSTESPYLKWLRNHSNYLAERGFLDYMRMIAVLLRGILINFLVILPFLLLLSAGLASWVGQLPTPSPEPNVFLIESTWWTPYLLTKIAAGIALFYTLMFPVMVRVFKVLGQQRSEETGTDSTVKLRDKVERSFSALMLIIVGFAIIESIPPLLFYFHSFQAPGAIAGALGGTSIAALTVVGRLLAHFKGVAKTLVMWLVGLLGLLLPILVVLFVANILIWGSIEVNENEKTIVVREVSVLAWSIMGIFIGLMAGGLLASLAAKTFGHKDNWLRLGSVGAAAVLGIAAGFFAVIIAGTLIGPSGISPTTFTFALAFVIWFFCWLSVNINMTSLLPFYRDRLCTAYLVGVDTDRRTGDLEKIDVAKVDIEEDLDLQKICQGELPDEKSPSIAPYHILNVAHNLQGSKDPAIRERNADFFMFSKKYYGGNRTGYCSTENLEAVFPQMDLATAMAISAAAASPNMGGNTVGPLVAIMTLFNIRLGYWVPNPLKLAKWAKDKGEPLTATLSSRFAWRIRPLALINEIRGALNETSPWVNVSDGGHLENLAVYELLRRRCKYIIAGDGEADPAVTFGSFAKLKRFASVDMGIEIDIDLNDVRKWKKGLSNNYFALGTITYPDKNEQGEQQTGYLLYFKSTVTGSEDEVIHEYRASHTDFPHESTADQFFDEGQFEAYRDLGCYAATQLFDKNSKLSTFSEFEIWFEGLKTRLERYSESSSKRNTKKSGKRISRPTGTRDLSTGERSEKG